MSKGRHAQDSGAWKKVTLVAGVATTGAIPLTVVSAPPAQAAPVSAWDRIATCESTNRWHLTEAQSDADSSGGLQIQTRTWNDYGGQKYAPTAGQATKQQQIEIAEKILGGQGPGAWVCNAMTGYPLSSSGPNSSYLKGGVKPYPSGTATPPKTPSTGGTYTVRAGDSLFLIAKAELGDGEKWPSIYNLNKAVVGSDPDLILPGQKLKIPGAATKTPPSAPQTTSKGAGVVAFMKSHIGDSFTLGANGPSVWDCSGLTSAAYRRFGVELPRLSQQQSLKGTPVALSAAQPGDLLYWGAPGSAHHVAVYIGGGRFIGAQNPASGVVEHPLSYSQPTGARRLF